MNSTIHRLNRDLETSRWRSAGTALDEQTLVTAFSTDLDWMAIAWRDDLLRGTVFGYASRRQAEIALARSLSLTRQFFGVVAEGQRDIEWHWVGELAEKLRQFTEGEPADFSNVPLALDHLTPFARRVVTACRKIPWGQVTTYGALAAACGSPGAARAVGSVMAKNRYPLVVPCHRVLAAGHELGGYSAPDGLRMKRRLLAMEGTAPAGCARASLAPL